MKLKMILENLPVSIYISKYKIDNNNFKIIDFQIIHNGGFSGFSSEELTLETIVKSFIDENELKNILNMVKNLSLKEAFNVKYHFRAKNGRILYFKDYIRVIDKKDDIYTFLGVVTDVSKETELSQIFEIILKSPNIGVVIYKDKIVLANETFKKILEIGDEIHNFSLMDLLPDEVKKEVVPNIKSRLQGNKFSRFSSFELMSKKGKRLYVEMFAETIFFDGGYAGLAFFIDKTQEFKNKNMLNVDLIVNSLIAQIHDEKELLQEIYEKLKETACFSEVKMNERTDKKELEVKNDCEKENYNSYLYLPIVVDGELIASYSLYSKYKNFFDEKILFTWKEIQKKIILALKNIQNQKNLLILKSAIDKSFQWVVITDKEGKIIYVNDVVEEISGYKKEEIIGKNPKIFNSGLQPKEFYKELWNIIIKGEIFNDIIVNKRKDGNLFYLKDKIIPIKIDNENYFVSLGIDITKEKLLEEELNFTKYIDALTKLWNRNGFLFNAQSRLKEGKNYALFIIDIEDFKLFNEVKGYKYGDLILTEFAKFLKNIFYNNDLIARLGNDDFAVLMEFDNLKNLSSVINKLLEKVKQKSDFPVNINIGIALYPKDAENIEELIEKAYIALSFNKKIDKNVYNFYNENISLEIENYLKVKDLVKEAIEKDEFIYYFQPYVDSENFKIHGAESLLRIKKENDIINPNVFIDYVEKSGIIKKIEILMIKKLINCIKELKFPFSFNLSGVSLRDEKHINKLIDLSKEFAEYFTIEITERELIENLEYTKKIFEMFKAMGYKIAIDDFGTGYSSLSYISNLPIDILKIDISFVRDIDINKKNLIIVDTIINFAKKLKLKTIAEGVEKESQIKILRDLGCDYIQGFYFYKPMPLNEFEKILN